MYKKKMDEYERGKSMLRTLVTPELYRILDEYIEVIKFSIRFINIPYYLSLI